MLIRLIIAAAIAVIFSGFVQGYTSAEGALFQLQPITTIAFVIVALLSAVLADLLPSSNSSTQSRPAKQSKAANSNSSHSDNDAEREEGTVKWFNVSKGFGFITRSNDEDIFVHYRSIRGQGRRRLFDGQTVTFVVIDSDKGLQADDVDVDGQ